jgi:hypothetical protein
MRKGAAAGSKWNNLKTIISLTSNLRTLKKDSGLDLDLIKEKEKYVVGIKNVKQNE